MRKNIDFSDMPPEIAELLKEKAEFRFPHREYRRGRESAQEALENNRVTDRESIERVLKKSFDFSEFQQLGLFHKNGYFENMGEYKESMPMLPQMFSPLFGKMMAEYALEGYVNATLPIAPDATFLSLGAGQGFLDYDLINHIASDLFTCSSQKFFRHAKAIQENSNFLVTDHGQNSLILLEKQLAPLKVRPDLSDRIQIKELDALSFRLDQKPCGIVYANELTDCITNELVALYHGRLYSLKIIGFNTDKSHVTGSEKEGWTADVKEVEKFIEKEEINRLVENGKTEDIRFMPVFIPVEYDEFVNSEINKISSTRNITKDNFGGIYPLHIGLDKIFENVKNSFAQGVMILVDYFSSNQGVQNYNGGINHFKHYRFGEEDITVYTDPQQVIERAVQKGFNLHYNTTLDNALLDFLPLVAMDPNSLARFNESVPDKMKLFGKDFEAMAKTYGFLMGMAEKYTISVFQMRRPARGFRPDTLPRLPP